MDKFQDKNLIPGLRGIIPSLHTPFNQDNSLDLVSLKKLVEHTIMTGCAGMLVGAVAGETSSLSLQEKQKVTELCVNHNNNRIPLIVGCSADNPKVIEIVQNLLKKQGAEWIPMPSAK